MASHDPRGLVDTTKGEINEESARLCRELTAGTLSTSLTELSLKKAGLTTLPPQIGALAALRKLDVGFNALSTLPGEISNLASLRIFFALGNAFETIPTVMGALPSLYMISFKSNKLTHIPEEALAPSVEWLILTDNKLTALPKSIGKLAGLKKCMLSNNKLGSLPDQIVQCRQLELIRLADNNLAALPDGFLALPALAWLGLAGNPCCAGAGDGAAAAPTTKWVPLDELEVHEQLGAGGGGFVHRATWRGGGETTEVALKIFRDAATVSDGDPAHEIDVGFALTHANVIRVLGASPAPKLGLVLELLSLSEWKELGLPPNFDTCARDTYPPDAAFATDHALRTLRGVAAAAAHLHAHGLTHGDLYAHNVMARASDGEAKLGDFGAAYTYRGGAFTGAHAAALERIEVRAFGCLVEEIAARLAPGAGGDLADALGSIARKCMAEDVAGRPGFDEVSNALLCC